MLDSPRQSMKRQPNRGLRKICRCPRKRWGSCPHPWHYNFKYGDIHYRGSLDILLDRHFDTRDDAQAVVDRIKTTVRDHAPSSTDELRRLLKAERPKPKAPVKGPTLAAVGNLYVENVSRVRERNKSWRDDAYMVKTLCVFNLDGTPLGQQPMAAITEDDLERFMRGLREQGRAVSTRNHYVQLLTSLFRWAKKKGHITRSPITEDTQLKRSEVNHRRRRFEGDEEASLFAAVGPWLQRLIIAALETACRQGELLKLQWKNVSETRRLITILATNAKSSRKREIPVSDRLWAILQMIRHDPSGRRFGPSDYVFGNTIGERIGSPKKAWGTAIRKAQIDDFTFHDLRHEAASRRHEEGWTLAEIQQLLGHANIKTTSTYLNVTTTGLQAAMKRSDEIRCNLVASEGTEEPRLHLRRGDEKNDKPLLH